VRIQITSLFNETSSLKMRKLINKKREIIHVIIYRQRRSKDSVGSAPPSTDSNIRPHTRHLPRHSQQTSAECHTPDCHTCEDPPTLHVVQQSFHYQDLQHRTANNFTSTLQYSIRITDSYITLDYLEANWLALEYRQGV
jgi:hypothetical protein